MYNPNTVHSNHNTLEIFNMKDVITENYQLMFGDCLERMKEIPSGSVDAIICDPPYIDYPKYYDIM